MLKVQKTLCYKVLLHRIQLHLSSSGTSAAAAAAAAAADQGQGFHSVTVQVCMQLSLADTSRLNLTLFCLICIQKMGGCTRPQSGPKVTVRR
jgi:hypothetical protein